MRYQVFTSGGESVSDRQKKSTDERNQLENISEYIRYSQDNNFIGKWALLVEWSDVHPYDHLSFSRFPNEYERETAEFLNSVSQQCCILYNESIYHSFKHFQTNTFQAIIITDVFTTYVIYTYKCGKLEWSGPNSLHAVVGYNLPGVGFTNDFLSGSPAIISIACRNRPNSDFVNIVYPFEANSGKVFFRICIIKYVNTILYFCHNTIYYICIYNYIYIL